jgi:hypothetical protein
MPCVSMNSTLGRSICLLLGVEHDNPSTCNVQEDFAGGDLVSGR